METLMSRYGAGLDEASDGETCRWGNVTGTDVKEGRLQGNNRRRDEAAICEDSTWASDRDVKPASQSPLDIKVRVAFHSPTRPERRPVQRRPAHRYLDGMIPVAQGESCTRLNSSAARPNSSGARGQHFACRGACGRTLASYSGAQVVVQWDGVHGSGQHPGHSLPSPKPTTVGWRSNRAAISRPFSSSGFLMPDRPPST